MYYVSRLFLLLFCAAASVLPLLAALDIGILGTGQSNYYARYFSLSLFAIGTVTVLFHIRIVSLNILVVAFIYAFLVGSLIGIIENGLSREFFAHVYYVTMPIFMIYFSSLFVHQMNSDKNLRKLLLVVMKFVFITGVIAAIIFVIGSSMGLNRYNATGSNLFYSASFLGFQKGGLIYILVSLVGTVASAKRVSIIVFIVCFLVIFYIRSKKKRVFNILPLVLILPIIGYFALIFELSAISRIEFTINQIMIGELNIAAAGRVSESAAALEVIFSDPIKTLFGAGFGAKFFPWDRIGYEYYTSHYTHFSPVAYWFFGGIFLPLVIFGYLFSVGIRLMFLVKTNEFPIFFYGFVPVYWGVLASSFSGPVILNDSSVWFFLGCGIAIARSLPQDLKIFNGRKRTFWCGPSSSDTR